MTIDVPRVGALTLLVAAATGCAPAPSAGESPTASQRNAFVALETELTAPAMQFDALGASCAIDGNTLISGARDTTTTALRSGRIYVYERTGSVWSSAVPLEPSEAAVNQGFGGSIGLDGDTFVSAVTSAAAFVFVRSGSTWVEQQKLTTSTTTTTQRAALSGDTIVTANPGFGAGESGEAYVFTRSGTVWTEQQVLTPSDSAMHDFFGDRLAIDGDTIAVGASGNDSAATDAGAVFIFTRAGTVWTERAKITSLTPAAAQSFGRSVALDGNTLVVGAGGFDSMGNFVHQGASVWTGSGSTWTHQADLVPSEAIGDDRYGTSVALDGDIAAVGSSAVAYVFSRSGSVWTERAKIDKRAEPFSSFGVALDVSGTSLAVGDVSANGQAGGQYVYDLVPKFQTGEACSVAADCAAGFCTDGVCCDAACDDVCMACTATKTGGTDGTCAPVAIDTDPDDDCADDGSPSCGANGLCDGAGACGTYGSVGCAPSDCDGDNDCASGHCAIQPGNATGICCDTACDEPCNSCLAGDQDVGGTDGVCGPVRDGTDPGDRCADTGPDSCLADGLCDGSGTCREFAVAGSSCGASTCSNALATGLACDGSGTCAPANSPCEPFACDGDTCGTSCANDDDCSAGFVCETSDCVQPSARCSDNGTTLIAADGTESSCAPYFCEDSQCRTTCQVSTDCVEGLVCDTTASPPVCISKEPSSADTDDGSGCGCRVAGVRERRAVPWWVLMVLALRRRRSR